MPTNVRRNPSVLLLSSRLQSMATGGRAGGPATAPLCSATHPPPRALLPSCLPQRSASPSSASRQAAGPATLGCLQQQQSGKVSCFYPQKRGWLGSEVQALKHKLFSFLSTQARWDLRVAGLGWLKACRTFCLLFKALRAHFRKGHGRD